MKNLPIVRLNFNKKKILLLLLLTVFIGLKEAFTQVLKPANEIKTVELSNIKIIDSVSTDCIFILNADPHFKGGEKAFTAYLTKNLNKNLNAKSTFVTVAFEIEEHGMLINPKVEKGFSKAIDKIIMKRLWTCPPWLPGIKDGKAMRKSFLFSLKLG